MNTLTNRAQIRLLPDGRRLHMQDGPIDVIVEAFGEVHEIDLAYRAAAARFVEILDELCSELAFLRRPAREDGDLPSGAIARRMLAAVRPYASQIFVTPMAAVAGAVADEILAAMISAAKPSRAYVNDGGDIAFHLQPSEMFVVGMVERPDRTSLLGQPQFTPLIRFAESPPAVGAGVVFRWALPMQSQCLPTRLRWPTLRRRSWRMQ